MDYVKNIFIRLSAVIVVLLILISSPILLALIGPFVLLRLCLAKLIPKINPGVSKILTTRNSILAVDDYHVSSKCTELVVVKLEGKINIEKLKSHVLKRVINLEGPHGKLKYPEAQQYVVRILGYMFWHWDEDFDIENHVKAITCDKNKFYDLRNCLISMPFAKRRSPWELLLINLPNKEEESTLILRVHHCLADGFSIMSIVNKLCDENSVFSPKNCKSSKFYVDSKGRFQFTGIDNLTQTMGIGKKMLYRVRQIFCLYELLYNVFSSFDSNSWKFKESALAKRWITLPTDPVGIETVKDIKNFFKVSFTSVIMSALGGGIRKFMESKGYKVPQYITCCAMLPMPGHPDKLRNYMSATMVRIPISIKDPVMRLRAVHRNLESLKYSTQPLGLFLIHKVGGSLFYAFMKQVFRVSVGTIGLSNFPGPDTPRSLAGHSIQELSLAFGLLPGDTAMSFGVLSYVNSFNLSVIADVKLLQEKSSLQLLLSYVLDELQGLKNHDC